MTSRDNTRIAIVLGTRPEIIKLAPIIKLCDSEEISYTLIHTGQHYSDKLDGVFFEQLGLDEPDYNLQTGSGNHGKQTGQMLEGIERILLEEEPDIVLVHGDTNSTLAGGIIASKIDVCLGHVEAGLRSFDKQMPEEVNRIITDHISDCLFAPTEESAELLRNEGISEDRISVVGNTIVDAVLDHQDLAARRSTVLEDLDISRDKFLLLTAHRPENVDDCSRYTRLLDGVARTAEWYDMPVIYPTHPRASKMMVEFDISVPQQIRLVEPQDFLDFLHLESTARLVFTDSGGVQEECCILKTPCVTLRNNTERPETVNVGANSLAGVSPDEITATAFAMTETETTWEVPFGDGQASKRILSNFTDELETDAELIAKGAL